MIEDPLVQRGAQQERAGHRCGGRGADQHQHDGQPPAVRREQRQDPVRVALARGIHQRRRLLAPAGTVHAGPRRSRAGCHRSSSAAHLRTDDGARAELPRRGSAPSWRHGREPAGRRASRVGGDLPRSHRRSGRGEHARRRPGQRRRPAALGRLPGPRGRPEPRRRDWLGAVGPALPRTSAARRPPRVPRLRRPRALRAEHAGRPAAPHPRRPDGPLLRTGPADHRGARRLRDGDRRDPRLPLLRRARPARFRRRHREPSRGRRGRRGHRRRRGPGLRGRQLRDRPEVPARPRRLGRAHRRAAGERDRALQAVQPRDARRGQAARRPHRTQRDRGRERRPAAGDALQHALRRGRHPRVRHLFHRLRGEPSGTRADADQHVPRDR